MYECSGCGDRFKTPAWLTRHQKRCDARKALLEAGSRKFQKAHGTPKASSSLLSRLNALISRNKGSQEQSAPSSSSIQPGPELPDNDDAMTDLTPPDTTEIDFVSCLHSLAAEETGSTEPLESSSASTRRGARVRRPTWKVRENQLADSLAVDEPVMTTNTTPLVSRPSSTPPPSRQPLRSVFDRFGLSRLYPVKPNSIPDPARVTFEEGTTSAPAPAPAPSKRRKLGDILKPYPNLSSFLFDHQFWTSSGSKSRNDRNALRDVIVREDFDPSALKGVNFEAIEKDLRQTGGSGWRETLLTIRVPKGIKMTKAAKRAAATEQSRFRRGEPSTSTVERSIPGAPITIHDFQHRSFCDIIRETFSSDPAAHSFHYHPYELKWTPPGTDTAERVHGELYTSQAWLDEDTNVQSLVLEPGETDRDVPRAIAAIMLASDATLLGPFASSKAWPIYVYFGNQSKYDRAKPTQHAAHHLAYLPSMPDEIQELIQRALNKAPSRALLTHCRRELFQAAQAVLLNDPEFQHAYKNGIIVKCIDGITRRLFPRIFTYSADYPEKTLVATIRDQGKCPCARCLVTMDEIPNLGTTEDRKTRLEKQRVDSAEHQTLVKEARKKLYDEGYAVDGEHVDGLLKDESLVPTENAFSSALGKFGLDIFKILTVDVLHEFELGVGKGVFIHLVRMLESVAPRQVNILNERFRQVPVFGNSAVCRFSSNVSEMKQMEGHDFENIIQCIIPCINGLLPEPHNTTVLSMLFVLGTWHSLAKLRMHTDSSLKLLDDATTCLGITLRYFTRVTCPEFPTKETAAEFNKRKRKEATSTTKLPDKNARKPKTFNMKTIKLHSLGDYVSHIRTYGTTDSYDTGVSELSHGRVKTRHRVRTSKKNTMRQLGNIDFVETQVRRIAAEVNTIGVPMKSTSSASTVPLSAHYHIAKDVKKPLILGEWLITHSEDPALKDFLPHLKQHLYARLLESDPLYDCGHYRGLIIQDGILYKHSIARFNFTTYDLQQDQDIIHIPFDKQDILVYNPEEQGPYPWAFARVLGIYHAKVSTQTHRDPKTYYFLWVRWFKRDNSLLSFLTARQFDQVEFVPYDSPDDEPFGFVNPETVIRGCHLIPDFDSGRTHDLMPASAFQDGEGDWKRFCVAHFSDRDLMMRFTGLGVGHLEYKSRDIHGLTVEDEPNWLELCPTAAVETEKAGIEPELDDDSDSDNTAESEDQDDRNF